MGTVHHLHRPKVAAWPYRMYSGTAPKDPRDVADFAHTVEAHLSNWLDEYPLARVATLAAEFNPKITPEDVWYLHACAEVLASFPFDDGSDEYLDAVRDYATRLLDIGERIKPERKERVGYSVRNPS